MNKNNFINYGISFGLGCLPRMRTDYYKDKNKIIKNKETNFFDYLMTDPETIYKILISENLDDILEVENIKIYHLDNKVYLKLLNFSRFLSIHDVENTKELNLKMENIRNNEILENPILLNLVQINFIDKYKRRHERLKENLRYNCRFIIMYDPIHLDKLKLVYSGIELYNKNILLFCITELDKDKNEIEFEQYSNIYYINLYPIRTKYNIELTYFHWDKRFDNIWDDIFNLIQNIYYNYYIE